MGSASSFALGFVSMLALWAVLIGFAVLLSSLNLPKPKMAMFFCGFAAGGIAFLVAFMSYIDNVVMPRERAAIESRK